MRPEDFDYTLPDEAIAQTPAEPRDHSRLLEVSGAALAHRRFDELPRLLTADDLLVVNDARVIPARLHGTKSSGGRVEVLLLEEEGEGVWQVWLRGSRKPGIDSTITFGEGLRARVLSRHERVWRLRLDSDRGGVAEAIEAAGSMPLPPYIDRPPEGRASDRERYQTVYATNPGAVAAPTAGLHFTPRLLAELDRRGIPRTSLTLYVGPGTFQPVQVGRIEDHRMHEERFELGAACVEAIRDCRARGGRVVAVGTTVVRVLEHCTTPEGETVAAAGRTSLFITPGHAFRCVDAMVTNFHLPRSTLLMLVAAFAGRERILAAYGNAVESGYRFYSYGDAMWVEP